MTLVRKNGSYYSYTFYVFTDYSLSSPASRIHPNIYTRIPIGWCLYDLSMCPLHNIKGHPRVFEDRDGFNNIHSKWLIPARRINIFIFYYYLFSNKCGKSLWHKLVVPIDFYYYHHWYFCSSNTNGRLPLEDTVPLV